MSDDDDEPQQDPTEPRELDPGGLLAEILGAPDRDRCPGARPVVSVAETDDAAFVAEVNAHCVSAPELRRRGAFHGHLAELDDSLSFVPRDPMSWLAKRFQEARPIVLHDALPDEALDAAMDPERSTAAFGEVLRDADGLDEWLEARAGALSSDFEVARGHAAESELTDERDIARRVLRHDGFGHDVWVKSQRLSTHPDDASVRLRFSFGKEGDDDASRDTPRHRTVARLAGMAMPEAEAIQRDGELRGLIGEWIGGSPLFTQAIAYWNAPNGGALFHHDAFDEPEHGRQRGVLYAQLTGATVWLALSTDDLAMRVQEAFDHMASGTFGGMRDELFESKSDFDRLRAKARDVAWAKQQIALPGQGELGPVVGRGPEFTSLLADAGHAWVVSAGDVVVLPNHGFESTCMHSVFCASEAPAFSLSLAIRDMKPASARPGSRSRRRRRAGSRGPRSRRRRR